MPFIWVFTVCQEITFESLGLRRVNRKKSKIQIENMYYFIQFFLSKTFTLVSVSIKLNERGLTYSFYIMQK